MSQQYKATEEREKKITKYIHVLNIHCIRRLKINIGKNQAKWIENEEEARGKKSQPKSE